MFSLSQSLGIQIRHSSHMVYSFFFLFYFIFLQTKSEEELRWLLILLLFSCFGSLTLFWPFEKVARTEKMIVCKSRKRQQHSPMNIYDWYWSLKRRECELYKAGWLNQAEHRIRLAHFGLPVHENGRRPYTCARLLLGRLTDWLAGQSCQGFRLSSLYNSLGFSFLTLVTRWPADAVTYGRSCRCCCCCCCRLAQHLTLFREEKKRNGSLSVYRLPYPNSLESLPNQLIGKNGEL